MPGQRLQRCDPTRNGTWYSSYTCPQSMTAGFDVSKHAAVLGATRRGGSVPIEKGRQSLASARRNLRDFSCKIPFSVLRFLSILDSKLPRGSNQLDFAIDPGSRSAGRLGRKGHYILPSPAWNESRPTLKQ